MVQFWTVTVISQEDNNYQHNVINIPLYMANKNAEVLHQNKRQAGTALGQAQLKLQLELTSFKICCIKLIILDELC